MALNWNWSEKCGEATFRDTDDRTFKANLYEGNAYLIFVNEYEKGGKPVYSVSTFWVDKEHMKNCLGLNKKTGHTHNIYNKSSFKLSKIKFNKNKCRHTKEIVAALVQAFDNIEIEIFTEENKND